MKKTAAIVALVLALAGVLYWHFKSQNGLTEHYEGLLSARNDQLSASLEREEALKTANLALDQDNTRLRADIAKKDGKIADLVAAAQNAQDTEPSQPELETQPLVISLRSQVKSWKEAFYLADSASKDKDVIIANLEQKCLNLEGVVAEWKLRWESEYTLRVAAERLAKKRRSGTLVWKLVALAGFGYGALK